MHIAFVQRDVFDYIGLMQLTAVAERAGHRVSLVLEFSDAAIMRSLDRIRPDVLGLNVTAGVSRADGFRLAKAFRAAYPKTPIVIGGSYLTLYPKAFDEAAADYLCVGEGEGALCDLLGALSGGGDTAGIPNIARRESDGTVALPKLRPLVENLDALPLPERRLHYAHPVLRNQSRKNFIVSRGCPFSCSYCYIATTRKLYEELGPFSRRLSPGRAVEEVAKAKRDYGMRWVGFMDDMFPYDKEWLTEFAALYRREVGLPFIASSRTECLDPDVVRLFAEAGCHTLGIGIETASEALRRGILDRRSETNAEIEMKLRMVKSAGIRLLAFNMMGIPGESEEDAWKTVQMNARVGADLPRFTVLTPSPGLRVAEAAVENRLCSEEDVRASGPYLRRSVFKGEHFRRVERIQKTAFAASRFPRWARLWRGLAKSAPGPALDLLYLLTNGYMFLKINRWGPIMALRYGRTVARWYE